MALDYLAMYLSIKFDLTEPNLIVAIRHFSASTARLSDAVKNGTFFTDLGDVKKEARAAAAAGQLTVLLDSTPPGRDKILPPQAQKNVKDILSKFNDISNPSQPTPRIGGPDIANFTIRSGIRNIKMPRPYNQAGVDNRNFKSGLFDISTSGGVEFKVIPPVTFDNNLFQAVTFSRWDRILLVNW